jgi:hypothetical protein
MHACNRPPTTSTITTCYKNKKKKKLNSPHLERCTDRSASITLLRMCACVCEGGREGEKAESKGKGNKKRRKAGYILRISLTHSLAPDLGGGDEAQMRQKERERVSEERGEQAKCQVLSKCVCVVVVYGIVHCASIHLPTRTEPHPPLYTLHPTPYILHPEAKTNAAPKKRYK